MTTDEIFSGQLFAILAMFFMLKGYNFVGYLVIVYVPYKAKAFCKIVNLIFLFCGQFVISRVQELFKLWGGAG